MWRSLDQVRLPVHILHTDASSEILFYFWKAIILGSVFLWTVIVHRWTQLNFIKPCPSNLVHCIFDLLNSLRYFILLIFVFKLFWVLFIHAISTSHIQLGCVWIRNMGREMKIEILDDPMVRMVWLSNFSISVSFFHTKFLI